MTPHEFIAKWKRASLSERSACQQHFCDLCDLLGQPKPAEADPEGTSYTFERGVEKVEGGHGWADVWKRDYFGWEYKSKGKDLAAAYKQLLLYREDLGNPPLLVVCDLNHFQVHTNFTGTAKRVYEFHLQDLANPANLDILRKLFTEPDALRPDVTTVRITEEAAGRFGELADGMRLRGVPAQQAAHFLMKLMFCMFGEDIGLLPPKLFSRVLEGARGDPVQLARRLENLFAAMAGGGDFGADTILRFNGGLFADSDVVQLTPEEINVLVAINQNDWANVEPSIFGTLFERTLDPAKRSQIGAHYTSREDIETLLKPVLMAPLRAEWEAVKRRCEENLWPAVEKAARQNNAPPMPKVRRSRVSRAPKRSKDPRRDYDRALLDFAERLAHVTVLDPACGSGNFLYVAIHLLLELEKEVIAYAASHWLALFPHVRPTQLAGLEINPYAQELAQVVIWIGYLQWMYHNGFRAPTNPVLEPIESIRLMDAILDLSDPENPKEPEWPEAEFIVGNPPFLGDKKLRAGLGHEYTDSLFKSYSERLPNQADLCCYWFEKARSAIERGKCLRAGLLATQGIRGGANRRVLERIKETGDIFFAESDRPWILEGANVHVSIVGFDAGRETDRVLDGRAVQRVNANLSSETDVTYARELPANAQVSYIGVSLHGPFELDEPAAHEMLTHGGNPHGKPNSDVLRPILNASGIVKVPERRWVVAFPFNMRLEESAFYQAPFEFVREKVLPVRQENRRGTYRDRWWLHGEARPAMQVAISRLKRFILTPRVGKHRVFVWATMPIYPSDATVVFAREDECIFGVLHSRLHEVWALTLGTRLETRPRYTPTTCFETFPLPKPSRRQAAGIAEAARELDELRSRWLNPPEWTKTEVLEFPGSVDGPWARYVVKPNRQGMGTVRWPRVVPKDPDCAESLKGRTLTNLYNERPEWLNLAHRKLDEAVFAAYGWDPGLSDEELLEKLLELNLARAGK